MEMYRYIVNLAAFMKSSLGVVEGELEGFLEVPSQPWKIY